MFKASCLTSRNVSKKLEMYCLFRRHSRLHCTFICKSCGGHYHQCECETVNRQSRPNKRQRNAEARETDSECNNKERQKRYDSLLKDHERLAQAFRNQEKETKLLGQQLEEKEKEYEEAANDAEELANLVRTKCEAIKTLEKRVVEAKKLGKSEEQLPQKTVGRLLVNSRPTVVYRLLRKSSANNWPFVSRLSADCWQHVGNLLAKCCLRTPVEYQKSLSSQGRTLHIDVK